MERGDSRAPEFTLPGKVLEARLGSIDWRTGERKTQIFLLRKIKTYLYKSPQASIQLLRGDDAY